MFNVIRVCCLGDVMFKGEVVMFDKGRVCGYLDMYYYSGCVLSLDQI